MAACVCCASRSDRVAKGLIYLWLAEASGSTAPRCQSDGLTDSALFSEKNTDKEYEAFNFEYYGELYDFMIQSLNSTYGTKTESIRTVTQAYEKARQIEKDYRRVQARADRHGWLVGHTPSPPETASAS